MPDKNHVHALRTQLLNLASDLMTPIALRYGYSSVPLETDIKWRPQVLLLGSYSSGKSTLINEFLGGNIQATGQAPTDDSFTVIAYDDFVSDSEPIRVTEERDGKYLLNTPEYPYEKLKKYGRRFTAHFRLKKVNAPFLKHLAIIDTPGMLDSVTERDRGYNYQEVIGDLAQIADLILFIFDPHKAGTVREAHTNLREILPERTFEDRVIFVLNRIDECSSLIDLLQVYGTLCWNLSQTTGRKDIPLIRLTYSPHAAVQTDTGAVADNNYLVHLDNHREDLKRAVLEAPRYRLDNLASFVETHSARISHLLEALISYHKKLRGFRIKHFCFGLLVSSLAGTAGTAVPFLTQLPPNVDQFQLIGIGGGVALLIQLFWVTLGLKYFEARFHNKLLMRLDDLTRLKSQARQDSWGAVRQLVRDYLDNSSGHFTRGEIKRDYGIIHRINETGCPKIRKALNVLAIPPAYATGKKTNPSGVACLKDVYNWLDQEKRFYQNNCDSPLFGEKIQRANNW